MCKATVAIMQTHSPIRRHYQQRATLIGLGLRRIGHIVERVDTPAIRGMLDKIPHLVRIVSETTEFAAFIAAVRAEYRDAILKRIERGNVLWDEFETLAKAVLADPNRDDRPISEKVNELVVAKLLIDDPDIKGPIRYEPDILPDGRRIDFVIERAKDNIYVEVKTVHPRSRDNEALWEKYLKLRELHPPNVKFIVDQDFMGAALYANSYASRSHFFDYTRSFEDRLAAAKAIKPGPGILIICGTGFAWNRSELEDFADFYLTRVHRGDDPFRLMELEAIKRKKIELKRNIDHFGCLMRHTEMVKPQSFTWPVRGPVFQLPAKATGK